MTMITKAARRLLLTALFLLPALSASAANPDCVQCHGDLVKGKTVHPAVKMGCESCHSGVDASEVPHKFTGEKGLSAQGNALCLQCHESVMKKPHAVTRFDRTGHMLSGQSDPKRPNKPFGCISCHVPHSSDWGKLFRYKADNTVDLCKHCHSFIQ